MEKFTSNESSIPVPSYDNEKWKRVINHSLWWLIFILYEMSSYIYASGGISIAGKFVLYYGINISLFYSHLYILNHTLKGTKRKYMELIVLVTAQLLLFLFVKIASDYYTTDFKKVPVALFSAIKSMAIADLYRCVFFIGLSSLYWTASNLSNFERKAKEAEIRQLTAERDALALQTKLARSENALLRQQINPHLLFNTLNFIHSTVYKVSGEAAETVTILADILRFSMEEAGEDGKVLLKKEIDQISNLITINRIRFKTASNIQFTVLGAPAAHRIIPLVLITLVENIFKHGNFIAHEAIIRLEISASGLLTFHTRNALKAKAPYPLLKSTGLENIRIRLDYAYGEVYELQTQEYDGFFESKLILPL